MEEDLKKLAAQLKEATDGVKKYAEQVEAETKRIGILTNETKQATDKAIAEAVALGARVTEMEQKLARRGQDRPEVEQSIGERFVADEAVKKFMAERTGTAKVRFKNVVTSAAASGGVLVQPMRLPGILPIPERRLTVRDLITPGRTTSNSIEYVRELVFTNSAAVVSETVQKPESNITFEETSTPVRTIAHWIPASKQIMDDAAQLQSYIDGRMRYGLAYAEELQLLKGPGTGQSLEGLVTAATAYAAPIDPAGTEQAIDVLRLAMLQVFLAEFPPTGIVLSPLNWAEIELMKDTTGQYLWANPRGALVQPGMWGLPIVETQAMDENEFLVGAFRLGAQIFDREDANVQISTEDRDNFIKNMVTIRAEERLALAIYRPQAFVTGDLP